MRCDIHSRLIFAAFCLLAASSCGGDDRDPSSPGGSQSCTSVANSCGRTIGGAFCVSTNGGTCETGTCDLTGSCGCDELDPLSCAGEKVCLARRCEDAFPRIYAVTITDVRFADRDPAGACWDEPGCGAPDPLVAIFVNTANVGQTPVRDDVFTASFAQTFDVQLIAGSTFQIQLMDADVTDHELAAACRNDPLAADVIRDRFLACDVAGNRVNFELRPK